MKSLWVFFLVLLSFNAKAQEGLNLDFWDGTFAYNRLVVKSVQHQRGLLNLRLSGSTLGLGEQLEGEALGWAPDELLDIHVSKKECDIDRELKRVSCDIDKVLVGPLRWSVNRKINKTYRGMIHELRIVADREGVSVRFRVPSDEFFSPHFENIQVEFPSLGLK